MSTILAAMQNSLLVLDSIKDGWRIHEHLKQHNPNSLALDPSNPDRVYCGTFDAGLWKTDNGGQTWEKTSDVSNHNITAISVNPIEKKTNGFSKLYVGTEPSIIFLSSDGGQTWERLDELNKLKSSSTWSFPPRPWTNHVRWIEPDKNKEGYIFVAIEAGALIKSLDGGKTWIDRVKYSPYDTHELRTHMKAPQRLYSAAGDGYFESDDYGQSWKKFDEGLYHHTYLASLALNSIDPRNMIVSAASNAGKAHSREDPDSFVYRRTSDEEEWELVTSGLPNSKGTIISTLESNPNSGNEFYCLNNRGIFSSKDSGISWDMLKIQWPKEYLLQHPMALAIID